MPLLHQKIEAFKIYSRERNVYAIWNYNDPLHIEQK